MRHLAQIDAVLAGEADAGEAAIRADATIRAVNPALNAIVDHDGDVLAPQLAVLRRRLGEGERPPLAGLPVTVKDHIHVAGWQATEGFAPFAGRLAEHDDVAVARLREVGAILIGRTNMSQFGCKGVTTNPIYGPTRHPQDLRLTSGGSSGGAASAVAAGLSALALAGDGGGSIRRPAAHVGVAGFKPSTGAIPNVRGLSHTGVLGLLSDELELIVRAFDAIRGPDPRDPASVRPVLTPEPPRLRWAWAPTLGLDVAVDVGVAARGEAAVAMLADAGIDLAALAPRWPEGACEEALMPLQHAGLAASWGEVWRRDPSPFDPDICAQIDSGLGLAGDEVARAEALSRRVAGQRPAISRTGSTCSWR